MTIYICGGSNSVLHNGWTADFRTLNAHHDLKNISIGATSGLTGHYRAVFCEDMQAGDVLIWEYNLNDAGQVQRPDSSSAFVLRHLEMLLAHCAERGIRVLPLIFVNEDMEARPDHHPHTQAVMALFSHWGLTCIDIQARFRSHLGADQIPGEFFSKVNHYRPGTSIIAFIANCVTEALDHCTVPVASQRQLSDPSCRLEFVTDFNAESEVCGTQLFSAPAWTPSDTLRCTLDHDGRFLAAVLMGTALGGVISIRTENWSLNLSGVLARVAAVRPRLSPSFYDLTQFPPLTFERGETLHVGWGTAQENLISGSTNMREATTEEVAGREARVYGFLTEALM